MSNCVLLCVVLAVLSISCCQETAFHQKMQYGTPLEGLLSQHAYLLGAQTAPAEKCEQGKLPVPSCSSTPATSFFLNPRGHTQAWRRIEIETHPPKGPMHPHIIIVEGLMHVGPFFQALPGPGQGLWGRIGPLGNKPWARSGLRGMGPTRVCTECC